jgi:hypothetical protein
MHLSAPNNKKDLPQNDKSLFLLAGELGFEPRLAESESAVLPLDDSPKIQRWIIQHPRAGLYCMLKNIKILARLFASRSVMLLCRFIIHWAIHYRLTVRTRQRTYRQPLHECAL